MNEIDVHIVRHPLFDYLSNIERLLEKLQYEPVNVQVVAGTARKIGPGRYAGFTAGNAPWCTYIDDDDDFEAGIFQKILDTLQTESDIQGLFTAEKVTGQDENGDHQEGICRYHKRYAEKWHVFRIHHLGVFKRKSIQPYLAKLSDVEDGFEHGLWANLLLNNAKIRYLDEVGYTWRQHTNNSPGLNLRVPEKINNLYQRLFHPYRNQVFQSHLDKNETIVN